MIRRDGGRDAELTVPGPPFAHTEGPMRSEAQLQEPLCGGARVVHMGHYLPVHAAALAPPGIVR